MYNPNENFFVNQSADIKTVPKRYHVTQFALFAFGIFDGASIRLEVSPSDYNPNDESFDPDTQMEWFDHPDGTYTDATTDEKHFWNNAELGEFWVRAVLENATLNTSVSFMARARLSVDH